MTDSLPKTDPLLETDVRHLVRMLADVAVTTGGIMVQRHRLMGEITSLLGAEYWMWNVTQVNQESVTGLSFQHNLSERQLALLAEENYSAPGNAYNLAIQSLCTEHVSWSRRLEDMVDLDGLGDELFSRSCPEVDMGQSLFSFQKVPDTNDVFSAIGLHRSHGAEPFTERELRLAHIVFTEVSWLHESGVPGGSEVASRTLSPRLQTVLALLVDGQAPKRIALHLELSPHTVRGYVKDIYRHFSVGSRAELMRRFMVGDGNDSLGR